MSLKKHDCLDAKDTGSKYNSKRVFYSSYSDSAVSEIPVSGTGKTLLVLKIIDEKQVSTPTFCRYWK